MNIFNFNEIVLILLGSFAMLSHIVHIYCKKVTQQTYFVKIFYT